jgi:hypothetical protein
MKHIIWDTTLRRGIVEHESQVPVSVLYVCEINKFLWTASSWNAVIIAA